jgi:hypothetical protein
LGGPFARRFCAALFGMAATVLRAQVEKPTEVAKTPRTEKPSATRASENGAVVRTAMGNVDYHLTDHFVVHIGELSGKLVTKSGEIPVFDDRNSSGIEIDSATIRIGMTSLTNDLNEFVFAKLDSPVKKLTASVNHDKNGNQLVIKGSLMSKGGMSFESAGTLSVTPEGWIRVTTLSVKAMRMQVHGLMDLLGLDTANLVNTDKQQGVRIDKNDLLLDPEKILPPPAFKGKLTMTNSMLELVDANPQNPYDFATEHYEQQLVAGYSKSIKAGGLCVHTPDLNKIKTVAKPGATK